MGPALRLYPTFQTHLSELVIFGSSGAKGYEISVRESNQNWTNSWPPSPQNTPNNQQRCDADGCKAQQKPASTKPLNKRDSGKEHDNLNATEKRDSD